MSINPDVAPSATKAAINKLKEKMNATGGTVVLSKVDIGVLTEALLDLDQRTSGIEKLPDGRTKLGYLTGGRPRIVIEEHDAARFYLAQKDYRKALRHSVNAITAYEQSKKSEGCVSTGRFTNHAIAKLYYLAAVCYQRLRNKQLAYLYAKKSTEAESNARNVALLSTTLANLGEIDKAIKQIQKALKQDPQNSRYQLLMLRLQRLRL